jgi:drug/metabolite transporter (DMT)-like permease
MTTGASTSAVLRAALWMLGALSSFLALAVAARELSAVLDTFQILFWRSAVGLVIVVAILSVKGWRFARTAQPMLQVLRNVVHFAGQWGWVYGVAHIAIAEVFAIEFTMPIWTLLLAALFLGERITRVRLASVLLGFAGILIIVRPGIAAVETAQLAVLGAAVAFALSAYVITKRLVATDTPLTILFWMTVVQLPIGFAGGVPHWTWPSGWLWVAVAAVGAAALGAHYCMARALNLADATVVVPMDFLRLPLAFVVGYLLYRDRVDVYVLIGALVIFAGNYLNVRAAHAHAAAAPRRLPQRAAR